MEHQTDFLEGFALSGEYVKNLKDKHFTIIGQPRYEEVPDLDDPTKTKRRLIIKVELADKQQIDWYPNKTSQKTICNKAGFKLEKWLGYVGEYVTESRKVMGNQRDVIFVKE